MSFPILYIACTISNIYAGIFYCTQVAIVHEKFNGTLFMSEDVSIIYSVTEKFQLNLSGDEMKNEMKRNEKKDNTGKICLNTSTKFIHN